MSENINFDFMPIFLKSNRDKDIERTFVNTQETDTEILKAPEFLENLQKSLHMTKSKTATEKNELLAQNSSLDPENKLSKKEADAQTINDLYQQLKV